LLPYAREVAPIRACRVSAVALVPAAQTSAQLRTTAPPPVVNIKVTITDTAISMSPKRAQRGDYARLVNLGKESHAFTLGNAKPSTGRQTGFTRMLRPKEETILLLFLDYRGPVAYFGTLAADRSKPGMKGFFTIS
jgi:hypothetical protein